MITHNPLLQNLLLVIAFCFTIWFVLSPARKPKRKTGDYTKIYVWINSWIDNATSLHELMIIEYDIASFHRGFYKYNAKAVDKLAGELIAKLKNRYVEMGSSIKSVQYELGPED